MQNKKHLSSVNFSLKQREAKMHKTILDLNNNDILLDMPLIELVSKLKVLHVNNTHTFASYTLNTIANFKKDGKYGNAGAYKNVLNFLNKYNGKSDIPFKNITPKLLLSLET